MAIVMVVAEHIPTRIVVKNVSLTLKSTFFLDGYCTRFHIVMSNIYIFLIY